MMDINAQSMVRAVSIKIARIEVTDFARNIGDFNNVYILKSVWSGEPTKLILRSYYQLWHYQCLLEKHIKKTPSLKEVLPPLPVVEDTDHMAIIEQYLMSLVLMVRNGSSMSAMIRNLFLPWDSDEITKQEYLSDSSKSPTKSDREVVGLKKSPNISTSLTDFWILCFMADSESFDSASNASLSSEEEIDRIFSSVQWEISNTFDQLLLAVTKRRDLLLDKLNNIRTNYERKTKLLNDDIQGLTSMKDSILGTNHRDSLKLSSLARKNCLEEVESGMRESSSPLASPVPEFNCEFDSLLAKIAELGSLADCRGMYDGKNRPYRAIGKQGHGKNEFHNPRSVFLDEKRNELYIVDAGNARIKILNIPYFEFKHEFGKKYLLSPWGITIWEDFIFVTDESLNQLLKFSLSRFKLVSCLGCNDDEFFNDPRGICTGNNGDIYVAYLTTNRVAVFTPELEFKQYIGETQLYHPHDVKFSTQILFVLDESPYCIHLYNTNGHELYRVVKRGVNSDVLHAIFFYLDSFNNIFISDVHVNSIKVFSKSGLLIHDIKEAVNTPKGLALTNWFKVVGNFSSDDIELLNVYEGDLVQNLGSVQQGWCFCKREQELGKLPHAILTPCTLTLDQIETERIRLLEIRDFKSVTSYPYPSNQFPAPECDYVEMNPLLFSSEVANSSPRKPPPFRPIRDKLPTVSMSNKSKQSIPNSPKSLPNNLTVSASASPITANSKVALVSSPVAEDKAITSPVCNKYVISDFEDTLTEDTPSPTGSNSPVTPTVINKLSLHKSRSKSLLIGHKKSSPTTEKKAPPFCNPETRVSKIDYYAKSSVRAWEEVKRAQLQDQTIKLTCVIHKDTVRPGCALCARSQWMAAENDNEEIYQCIEPHRSAQQTQLIVDQGDLVKVIQKNKNGWWDVSIVRDKSKAIKSIPATKLSREPHPHPSKSKPFVLQRRNTSLETLEHDYYDLTEGVEQKISATESVNSFPPDLSSGPQPYLSPIQNAHPPPPVPTRIDSSPHLSVSELSRTKTTPTKLKLPNTESESEDQQKCKTLSPADTSQKCTPNSDKNSRFFLMESLIYQSSKYRRESESVEKSGQLGLFSKFSTLSGSNDNTKQKNYSFVSYISEGNKVDVPPTKTKLERMSSGGSRKNLSQEEKAAWSTLGKQNGFFGSLSKERAEELLKQNAVDGEYLIRASSTKEDSFVLCVYHGTNVHRYLIQFKDGKFVTGEPPLSFTDFSSVVSHYKLNALEVTIGKEDILLKQPLLMKRQQK
ncbi:NHL repeat containing protein [Oopsacas minuta]|uniref:NHL repeat containing protein n=1 Tax=Oopsacas minuta TaxID=111878 RepID=A0AAV7JGI3_9METZ|nr:NHL repeat containing protein [Oopsacas minuta]